MPRKAASKTAPEPAPPAGDALLTGLGLSIECLCNNVTSLAGTVVALTEQVELLRHRLERLDGRLDRAELVAADIAGYPVTQDMVPHIAELRDRIENGRRVRR